MTIDGEIEVKEDEIAFLREFVAWLKERGASYNGYIRAMGEEEEQDVSGTFSMKELEALP